MKKLDESLDHMAIDLTMKIEDLLCEELKHLPPTPGICGVALSALYNSLANVCVSNNLDRKEFKEFLIKNIFVFDAIKKIKEKKE